MITYGHILDLWNLVLPWIMQSNPPKMVRQTVLLLFEGLGVAIHHDTGLENFNNLERLRDRPIGPETSKWLTRVRPELEKASYQFKERLELIINPSGKLDLPPL